MEGQFCMNVYAKLPTLFPQSILKQEVFFFFFFNFSVHVKVSAIEWFLFYKFKLLNVQKESFLTFKAIILLLLPII